jgi:hypothetical protein
MKRIAATLLLLAFATQLLSKVGIMVYYQFNKEYITKTYCVNKEKPQMHCNGHCHMQKQLKKQDEQPNKPGVPNLKDIHESFVFFENNFVGNFMASNNFSIHTNYFFSINASQSGAVFHPPC